jgi:V/A-type H+-transporting ATPase subunit C
MAWKYKRLMPKVLGFKQKLLTIQDLLGLLGRSLEEIVGVLQTSPYNAVIAAIPEKPVDAAALERALREDYIRTLEAIVDASPKDIQRLLTTIRSKFEVHNIKALLRAKRAKLNVDEAMRYVIPIGRLDDSSCREVYRHAGSYADILPLLADSGYPLLPDEDDTVDEMFVLEASLDRDVNRRMWDAARRLRGRDKKIAETLIGMEIASATLKTMLRSKALGISKEYVLRHVQPAAGFSQEDYEAAFDQVDLRSTIELLGKTADKASRDIRYLLQDLSRECDAFPPLSRVEAVFDRNLLTASQRMLKRYTPFFNVGLVLAFLNAKWFEVRNLSTIARGAVDELPPDRVTELLILPGI